ncbi:MAG: hypothetical protein ABSD85_07215 [Acidimicrobiales bacterium]|jgi:hypothetical protein
MELNAVLGDARGEILDEATGSVERSHLWHYEAFGHEELRSRLEALFDIVLDCLDTRRLDRVIRYAEKIAHDRFNAGFGIGELQTAFNVLEESMWHRVVAGVPNEELAESLGLLTTVLGVGKDALARAYVSLASHEHVASLDLRALFQGT